MTLGGRCRISTRTWKKEPAPTCKVERIACRIAIKLHEQYGSCRHAERQQKAILTKTTLRKREIAKPTEGSVGRQQLMDDCFLMTSTPYAQECWLHSVSWCRCTSTLEKVELSIPSGQLPLPGVRPAWRPSSLNVCRSRSILRLP